MNTSICIGLVWRVISTQKILVQSATQRAIDDDLECIPLDDHSPDESDAITLVQEFSGKLIPTANQACDYQKRGDVLGEVNAWDFVAHTAKIRPRVKKSQAYTFRGRRRVLL
jgi:hypothetical protein